MFGLRAWLYDVSMRRLEHRCLAPLRRELLSQVTGRVLEIGAGTGASLGHYPSEVLPGLIVTDPSQYMLRRLAKRCAEFRLEPPRAMTAERLEFPDNRFDYVVSCFALCTVENPAQAIGEIKRVLRSGGRLVFLEHICAPDGARRRRWQGWLRGIWRWVAGGCDLCRRTDRTIADGGLVWERLDRSELESGPGILRQTIRGLAVKKA